MLLTMVTEVGSLLRAALNFPKPGHPWSAWNYYNDETIALSDFMDHPVKKSSERVSISSETRLVYV